MRFLVRMTYEKEDYDAFARLSAKKLARGRTIGTRLLFLLVAVACVCFAVYARMSGDRTADSVGWIMVVLAVLFLCLAFFFPLYQSWVLRRHQPADLGETVYTFKEKTFHMENGAGGRDYEYARLVNIYETEDHFFLMLSEKSALVLPKRSFVSGTPRGLREFLEEKTGRPVVAVSL